MIRHDADLVIVVYPLVKEKEVSTPHLPGRYMAQLSGASRYLIVVDIPHSNSNSNRPIFCCLISFYW